jgi:serine/threonine-protein kinase
VSVYDTGVEEVDGAEVPYIVMEYVEGRTLRGLLDGNRRVSTDRAYEITSQVLDALAYSHDNGIVHRDIKPGNIMVTPSGAVKVMDFGIARAVTADVSRLTGTATVVGTAAYISPEQACGEPVDARSDIYSTGCMLYELLTGRPPFVGESALDVAQKHVDDDPVPPSALDPDIRPEDTAIVMRALEKDPARRFQSAVEMSSEIRAVANGGAGRPAAASPATSASGPDASSPAAPASEDQPGADPAAEAEPASAPPQTEPPSVPPRAEPPAAPPPPAESSALWAPPPESVPPPPTMPVPEPEPVTLEDHRPPVRRKRVPLVVSAAMVLVLAMAVGATWWIADSSRTPDLAPVGERSGRTVPGDDTGEPADSTGSSATDDGPADGSGVVRTDDGSIGVPSTDGTGGGGRGGGTAPDQRTDPFPSPGPGSETPPPHGGTHPGTTPQPTGSPQPSESPAPSDTPGPSESPEPSETPEPSESPEPGETPGPTDSPEPSETPDPGESPGQSGGPNPSGTPEPSESPDPGGASDSGGNPDPGESPDASTTPDPGGSDAG